MGTLAKDARISLDESDHQQIRQNAEKNPSQNFKLVVVQEPHTGKAISSNLRARGMKWPIEPPPVLELVSPEKDAQKWLYIHNPNFFCVAELHPIEIHPTNKKTNAKKDTKEGTKDNLSGLLASSLHKVKNPDDRNEHGYFVFGDLNVRDAGRYTLKFTLFEMRRYEDQVYAAKIDSAVSSELEVVGPKSTVPTKDSTKLSKILSESGVKIRLRKESTKRKQHGMSWSASANSNLSYNANHAQSSLAPVHHGPMPPPSSNPSLRQSRNAGEDIQHRMSVEQTSNMHTHIVPNLPHADSMHNTGPMSNVNYMHNAGQMPNAGQVGLMEQFGGHGNMSAPAFTYQQPHGQMAMSRSNFRTDVWVTQTHQPTPDWQQYRSPWQ